MYVGRQDRVVFSDFKTLVFQQLNPIVFPSRSYSLCGIFGGQARLPWYTLSNFASHNVSSSRQFNLNGFPSVNIDSKQLYFTVLDTTKQQWP